MFWGFYGMEHTMWYWGEGHTFVSHLKVGGQQFFNQNMREGQHFLLEKKPKFPSPPPPPKKKRTFPKYN